MLCRSFIIVLGVAFIGLFGAAMPVATTVQTVAVTQDADTPTAFTVDSGHSTLLFRVRHSGVSYFHGRVNKPSGSFVIDGGNLDDSSIYIIVETANIDSASQGRDQFLKGPAMFNAAEYPMAAFRSTTIRKIADGTYEATGDFTMHGVTKPIVARISDYTALKTERFGYRAGFECIFTVKRSEYGMDHGVQDKSLGDDVRITVAIEGVQR